MYDDYILVSDEITDHPDSRIHPIYMGHSVPVVPTDYVYIGAAIFGGCQNSDDEPGRQYKLEKISLMRCVENSRL